MKAPDLRMVPIVRWEGALKRTVYLVVERLPWELHDAPPGTPNDSIRGEFDTKDQARVCIATLRGEVPARKEPAR